MIEFLGVIFGGLLRLAPAIMDFLGKKNEGDLELRRLELEASLDAARSSQRLQEIQAASAAQIQIEQVKGDASLSVAEVQAMADALKGQMQITGDRWLDRLNVSVRPVLTYWWCIFMHTGYKICMLVLAVQQSLPLAQWGPQLYTDFDRGVVGSIIGFWFLDRALMHAQGNRNA